MEKLGQKCIAFAEVIRMNDQSNIGPFVNFPAVCEEKLEAMNVIAFVMEVVQQFKGVFKVLAHSSDRVNRLLALSETTVDLIVNFMLSKIQISQMLKHP